MAQTSLLLKIGILTWSFLVNSFIKRNNLKGILDQFFCSKKGLKCPKAFIPLAAKSIVIQSSFGVFWPHFETKIDPKYRRGNCFYKRIHQKRFQLKIPIFSMRHLVAKQLQKNALLLLRLFLEFRTWSCQQCTMCSFYHLCQALCT